MNPAPAAPVAQVERALIFAWERVRRVPVILPGFIVLVLFGHIGVFFLFRVVYPPQASLEMPHPTITVLDRSRPDHQALLRWADAEDIAPASTQTSITDRLLEVSYRPSYATVRTAPLTLPPETTRVQYPPPRDPLALIRSVEAKPAAPVALPPSAPTLVRFSGELARRVRGQQTLALEKRSAKEMEPAEFLIGVTDRGELRFVVLQRSSGNETMDAQASELLSRLELAPSADPITWGRATIQWGADAYRAETPSAKPPTPTPR